MRRRPLLVALTLMLLLLVVFAGAAWAQADHQLLDGKFRSGDRVLVATGDTVEHDLYATGGRVEIDGDIDGDLIAAAGQIVVRGTVTGDVMMAGGTLGVPGAVEGSVRAAGGDLMVDGQVDGDLVTTGGQVRIASGASVGGDVLGASGQFVNDGTVGGDLVVRAGGFGGGGTVAGTEDVLIAQDEPPTTGERVADVFRRYVSLVVVAAVLLWLARRLLADSTDTIQRRPLPSLGVGLLGVIGGIVGIVAAVLVVVVVALVLGLVTLGDLAGLWIAAGGLTVAGLVLAFVATVAFVAQIVAGLWIGRFAVRDVGAWPRALAAAAIGLAVIVALVQVPYLGPFVRALAVVAGVGGLLLALWHGRRPAAAPPARIPAT